MLTNLQASLAIAALGAGGTVAVAIGVHLRVPWLRRLRGLLRALPWVDQEARNAYR